MRASPAPALLALVALASPALAGPFPAFREQTIDPRVGDVCYAVTVADINGDGKPDVVAVSEDAVVWYENPTWQKRDVVRGATARDNVCVAAHDIDGDGKIDLALGAGWRPPDTAGASTLQWLGRDAQGEWRVHPIRPYDEPSMHRMRWGDVTGDGKPELLVAPLQGRGTKGPDWGAGAGVKVLSYSIPADPVAGPWPVEVADDSLHTTHNLQAINLDDDPAAEVLLAAWEGVFRLDRSPAGTWSRAKLGTGDAAGSPFKGASEIKHGRLAGGRAYLATIEPWHGTKVVVYTPPPAGAASGPWVRTIIADPVKWGHAVWTANLDDDADDELIIGQRDPNAAGYTPRGPGIFVFDPKATGAGVPTFDRHTIDDGGMACEDALAADLDGDGRPEIVAGGRATHNVKIYWNGGAAR
jgi:hypothetical protein